MLYCLMARAILSCYGVSVWSIRALWDTNVPQAGFHPAQNLTFREKLIIDMEWACLNMDLGYDPQGNT